jgi:hypothetical protein
MVDKQETVNRRGKVAKVSTQAALISSNWNNGTNAGMFNLNVNNAATNRNVNISFHTMLSF